MVDLYIFLLECCSRQPYTVLKPHMTLRMTQHFTTEELDAFCILHENKLVVYNAALGSVASTELGKIASHFYINFETINLYGKMLKPWHSETDILSVFSNSGEFKYVPVREKIEISKLMEKCPINQKTQ